MSFRAFYGLDFLKNFCPTVNQTVFYSMFVIQPTYVHNCTIYKAITISIGHTRAHLWKDQSLRNNIRSAEDQK